MFKQLANIFIMAQSLGGEVYGVASDISEAQFLFTKEPHRRYHSRAFATVLTRKGHQCRIIDHDSGWCIAVLPLGWTWANEDVVFKEEDL